VLTARNTPLVWNAHARTDGGDSPRVGRKGDFLVAEWPGIARLTCDLSGKRSRFSAVSGADPETVSKLRYGAARALLGDVRGGLSLHASAVAFGERAILVVGPSGSGKSTAAGDLCIRRGARLLADDMASLDVRNDLVRVNPTERQHYLGSASLRLLEIDRSSRFTGKRTLRAARAARRPVPLALVALLRPDGRRSRPAARALEGAEVVRALLPSVVRFDVCSPRPRELDQIFALHACCRVVEITRPVLASPTSLVGDTLLEILDGASLS
jgi:hypothetical protein